ncbi:MAG: 6-bladed beta-propeller [Tannerellaceae bacterium]|nr:6-bladed beta-propeller [Tannerellaceae bacterium]
MKTIRLLIIFWVFFSFVFPGCNQKTAATEEKSLVKIPAVLSLHTIHTLQGKEMLSGIGTAIRYIPLETTDNSLLRNVSKIALLKNGNLVVSDNQSLYLFDPAGNFIRPVSQRGNGPADYTRISALAAHPVNDGFFVQTNKKVIAFDGEGNFLNQFETEDRPMDMVIDMDGTILLHRMNVLKAPEDTTTTWFLYRYDPSGIELQRIADPAPRLKGDGTVSMVMPMRPFYLYDGQIRISEIGNDTIYTVGEKELSPYTVVDLGQMSMSATPTGTNVDAVFDDLSKKLMLSFLSEDDHYLYMVFGWGFSGNYLYSTYNKVNGTVVNYGNGEIQNTEYGLTNDIDGGLPFYPYVVTPDGTRIMWKSASDFKNAIMEKDYEKGKSEFGSKFETLWNMAGSIDEDDNPVLILVP